MVAATLALAALAGCQKNADSSAAARQAAVPAKPEVPATAALVAPAERSRHFAAVSQHLELGGTLYGYVDIDGDVERLATLARGMVDNIATEVPQAAAFKQDFVQIAADLGLSDVKAVGLSSVADPSGGFRNRCFFYTPAGRRGLLAGLGGPATPFENLRLAPANADVFCENDLDLPSVYASLRTIVARVAGEAAAALVETQLKSAGKQAGISAYDIIQSWKGRTTCVLRFEGDGSITIPAKQPFTIPAFSLLLRFDGIAPSLKPLLDSVPVFEKSEANGVSIYALKPQVPVDGWAPLLAIDGNALCIATSRTFFDDCFGSATPRLAAVPDFAASLAALGREGNGLTYISPNFFARLRQLPDLNRGGDPEMLRALNFALVNFPQATKPLLSVRTNLPDGILFRSAWNASLKGNLAALAIYNPVTIGVMSAMAIPAFQKVRGTSQEKTIQNNLRQLSAAAQQYYLETSNTNATYDDLVGPDRYIKALKPVAGENYRSIIFKQGSPIRITLPDGRTFKQDE
jgi:type IV pilus assembly protein PilA